MDSITIFRRFIFGRAKEEARILKDSQEPFRLGSEISWLYDPSVICPFCDQSVPTGRTWLLDNNTKRIISSYDIKTKGRIRTGAVHPHCNRESSTVCMGTASDLSEALFLNLNPLSAYWNIREFMADLEHECGEKDKYQKCKRCSLERLKEQLRYDQFLRIDGVCLSCWKENNRMCSACERPHLIDQSHIAHTLVIIPARESEESGRYRMGPDKFHCLDCWKKPSAKECVICARTYSILEPQSFFANENVCWLCTQGQRIFLETPVSFDDDDYIPIEEEEDHEEEEPYIPF